MIKNLFVILGIVIIAASCQKDSGGGTFVPNLQLTAATVDTVAGLVNFTANAAGATSYDFDFGDGTTASTADGKISHIYTKIGRNTFFVVVTARTSSAVIETRTTSVVVNIAANLPDLVWADEFDVAGAPSPTNWTFEIGRGDNGWGNAELQYYTNRPQNATVTGGALRITAIRENFSGAAFTSSRLITKGKFEFMYGRIEARAKLPTGVGTWPAIWMLGADINTVGWPACGEIDNMEHVGRDLGKIHGSLHFPGRSGGNPVTNSVSISNVNTEFHVYTVDWSATAIKFFVDGNEFFSVPNNSAIPFNKDFFLIVNIAMGGTFGGPVDPAFTSSSMEIDYIRVFNN
jgi:beta-glucanase (GH16 family)